MRKKGLYKLFGFLTAMSMTGCMMQFEGDGILNQVGKEIISVIKQIDETDLLDDKALDELSDTITGFGDSIAENNLENGKFVKAKLIRVVDGDTIVVEINKEQKKVRLIGVNTPESVAPDSYRVENTEEGILASDYVKTLLKNTDEVYLVADKSDTDRYGRLLRYVWLEVPQDERNINEIATKMLNGILLMDHVAEPVEYKPDTSYAEEFEWIYDNM